MEKSPDGKDILRLLTESEFDDLLLLYKNNYDKTNYHYISLYTQYTWNRKLSELGDEGRDDKWMGFRKCFFTHRNGKFANGTYISLHWDMMLSVQFYTLEPSLNELRECLLQTKLIDWKSGPLVTGVTTELYDFVNGILEEVGAVVERPRKCKFLVLRQEEALRLQEESSPEGFSFRQLLPSDADLIHSVYVNKKEASLTYIRGLILLNKTLGVIRASDSSLVGWIFQNDFNGLGILNIVPEERRKGLGLILGIQMCRSIATEQSVDISAFAVVENASSRGLLQKIGFKNLCETWWIQLGKL